LTVPTAKPVADFHRQVIAHAGRTQKSRCLFFDSHRLYGELDTTFVPLPILISMLSVNHSQPFRCFVFPCQFMILWYFFLLVPASQALFFRFT
ncbi:hypothetical protein, partial [Paenibacillus solani]|uniref:hypothetical protein n=1 Tax=Paenibacillus solani TaxID=1705565 RepID=UPI001A93C572